ncbi:hypothetical protein EDC01DRAFT_234241 [Geopyxis carbonaria]|nr:hypothetical protein EDC01DRAFT_234241 [Geopyxis carbonaria]
MVSLEIPIQQLFELCFQIHAAKEEMEACSSLLDLTSELLGHVCARFEKLSRASLLPKDTISWIETRIESAKQVAGKIQKAIEGKRSQKARKELPSRTTDGIRRIVWVFRDKGTAENYTNEINTCNNILISINIELAMVEIFNGSATPKLQEKLEAWHDCDLKFDEKDMHPENIKELSASSTLPVYSVPDLLEEDLHLAPPSAMCLLPVYSTAR